MSGLASLYRLTWSGLLGAAEDEIFSYTRHAGTITAGDGDTLVAIADSAATDVTDLLAESTTGDTDFSTISQLFPESVQWTQLKVYSVNATTGEATSEPEVRVLTDVGEGIGLRALTNQDALAITTQKLPRDAKSRNRFYLPTMVVNVLEDTGHVTGTLIDDIQTQLKFADNAHQVETIPWQYCVYSPTSTDFSPIDRYYSGDVMDTIRRRRNKLIETRHPLAA